MQLQAVPEPRCYSDQAGPLATILKALAAFVPITGMVFAALMGLIGGLLPALRAARMPITRALRDA